MTLGDGAGGEKKDRSPQSIRASPSPNLSPTRNPITHSQTQSTLQDTEATHERPPSSHEHNLAISRTPSVIPPVPLSLPREIAFIAVLCCSNILTQSGLALGVAPLQIIGQTLGTSNPGQLSWLVAGYSLTVGTFILPAGRWGDLYGHKRLFVIGWIWYGVWSLVAGFSAFAKSIIFFTFCRAMQGIGPALLLPNAIAILGRVYPPGKRKSMAFALFAAGAPVGFNVATPFIGLYAELVWWPWSFWTLGMVCGCLAVLTVFVVPGMPVVGGKPNWAELDLLGSVLGVSGLILFNFAWNEGPAVGWDQVYVYVLLIIGIAVLFTFFLFEIKWAKYPILPPAAFTRDTSFVFACLAACWGSFGIWVYYFWQIQINLRHNSILLTAAKNVPLPISGVLASVFTGWVIQKIQPGLIMVASMTFFLTGMILMATVPVQQVYWAQTFVSASVMPWGMDLSFPSSLIVLSNVMPPEHQGVAASLVNTVVNYSISIGLGMAATVETHVNNGGKDVLGGYRGALYLGIGLDGLGFVLAICLALSWRATLTAKASAEQGVKSA